MEGEYYKTKESAQEYIRLAKDVSGVQLIEKLKQLLPPKSSLLEIGSGPGTDWNILNQTYNAVGSDNSLEFLKHLNTENPNGLFLELDAISLNTDKYFDAIYSNKVLHHLKDDELADSVKRQYEILNANGIICHSFWKGEGSEVFKGLFVNSHTETNLNSIFKKFFDIISIENYMEFEANDSLLLLAMKKSAPYSV